MVAGRRELRVEGDGAIESRERLFAPIQDEEQKSDFVLDAGRLGIEHGGLLPGRECPGSIAPRLQFDSAGFKLLQLLLADRGKRDHDQQEEATEETPRVMNTTVHCFRSSAGNRTAIFAFGPGPRGRRSVRRSWHPL